MHYSYMVYLEWSEQKEAYDLATSTSSSNEFLRTVHIRWMWHQLIYSTNCIKKWTDTPKSQYKKNERNGCFVLSKRVYLFYLTAAWHDVNRIHITDTNVILCVGHKRPIIWTKNLERRCWWLLGWCCLGHQQQMPIINQKTNMLVSFGSHHSKKQSERFLLQRAQTRSPNRSCKQT